MNLQILHSGCYHQRQHFIQSPEGYFILSLILSGVDFMRIYTPSGKTIAEVGNRMLILVPPGYRVGFSFDGKRENHVLYCRIAAITHDVSGGFPELEYRGMPLKIPFCRTISPEKCIFLRTLFVRITELLQSAVPASIFAAEQLAGAILGELIEDSEPATGLSPEEQLKKLIDDDIAFAHTLQDFGRELRFSRGHLRKRFAARYGTDPEKYRIQVRLNRIMELIRRDDLSLKEVAIEAGMKNVTHLYAFFRDRCGLTPGELRKQYHAPPDATASGDGMFRDRAFFQE